MTISRTLMPLSAKLTNMLWNQHGRYWLYVQPSAPLPTEIASAFALKRRALEPECWVKDTGNAWAAEWQRVSKALRAAGIGGQAAVIGGEEEPDPRTLPMNWKSLDAVDDVAGSMWLAEALQSGDVLCYLQPVVSGPERVVGYESFARVRTTDGRIIGGLEIVRASRALGIEYAIDRHLHIEAIKTFVNGNVSGFLFVNFFPGFIQRPEVYLEGLSETVRVFGVIPKNIVLDFTQSENPRDMTHLKKVTEYCRSRGYAIALDDLESLSMAQKLVPDIRPDFVKLDKNIAQRYANPADLDMIRQILGVTRQHGGLLIAEGVETESMFTALKQAGIDLFQGYYFSPPAPVGQALKAAAGNA